MYKCHRYLWKKPSWFWRANVRRASLASYGICYGGFQRKGNEQRNFSPIPGCRT
jgi:hypothetical protein